MLPGGICASLSGQPHTEVIPRFCNQDPDAASAKLAEIDDFANWKKKYDRSKKTVTRTEYEVDFIEYTNKLAGLGVQKNNQAYLVR